MRMGLQIGLCYPGKYGNHFDTVLAIVQACEQAGLDSVWMPDHFMFPDEAHPEKEVPVMECFVVLGAIAARTSRLRIGELVTGVPYRNPALLAKICATLDVISHGRSIVGLGAAWHEPEFTAYGWPFPPVLERMEKLEEAVSTRVNYKRCWFLSACLKALYRACSEHLKPLSKRLDELLNNKRLGLSEGAVKSAIWRLRQRHRDLLREEIAQTVATPAEMDDEIRYLISMMSG